LKFSWELRGYSVARTYQISAKDFPCAHS
jgi:hypothetical protein